ncbi:hypothetical protein [Paenibacillus dakarensis]|uniref:hypothetical protein n=1 Tax=Paenibacillus dakarensis TaxID=1527293 RepID=UPI0006D554D3|nr:hypothetical protein [Paenibacillus dakarensis]
MKKTISIATMLGLALTMTAVASADPNETTNTVPATTGTPVVEAVSTQTSTPATDEPVIKAEDVVIIPTKVIQLTSKTYFYDMPNGKIIGSLAPQKVDTTTTSALQEVNGEWVEIYTWLGKAWIYVGNSI